MARDLDVDNLLENGNMEQLAALVLNGEGRRLVGRQSGNPELQAFIDNVPTYMVRAFVSRHYIFKTYVCTSVRVCNMYVIYENIICACVSTSRLRQYFSQHRNSLKN